MNFYTKELSKIKNNNIDNLYQKKKLFDIGKEDVWFKDLKK